MPEDEGDLTKPGALNTCLSSGEDEAPSPPPGACSSGCCSRKASRRHAQRRWKEMMRAQGEDSPTEGLMSEAETLRHLQRLAVIQAGKRPNIITLELAKSSTVNGSAPESGSKVCSVSSILPEATLATGEVSSCSPELQRNADATAGRASDGEIRAATLQRSKDDGARDHTPAVNVLMHSNRFLGANLDATSDKESDVPEGGPVKAMTGKDYELMPAPVIMDSGASEHVMPLHWCPQAELEKGSSFGRTYAAANGSTIKNEGEKTVLMVTKDGQWRGMKFQVCDVTRPLYSVHELCETGHSVVFSPSWDRRGSYIYISP